MPLYPDYITLEVNEDGTLGYYVNHLEIVDLISIISHDKEEIIDLLVCLGTENDQPN